MSDGQEGKNVNNGPQPPEWQRGDDEIDLVQLWLILARRRAVVFGVLLLCLAAGIAAAFMQPIKYNYSTAIDIGTVDGKKIASTEMMQAIVEENLLPRFSEKMAQADPFVPGVVVRIPKNSELLVLQSKGKLDDAARIRELHTLIVNALLEESLLLTEPARKAYQLKIADANLVLESLQDPRISAIKEKALQIQISQAKQKSAELNDQEKLLQAEEKQLTDTQILLRQQIQTVEQSLAQAYAARPKAVKEVGDESKALTLLMINSQVQQENNRLAGLQERLNIKTEEQKSRLVKKKEDLKRSRELHKLTIDQLESQLVKFRLDLVEQQKKQKNIIATIENKIDQIKETRSLGLAVRSLKPIGPGKVVIATLASVMGLMLGVMLAFLAEFVANARQRVS